MIITKELIEKVDNETFSKIWKGTNMTCHYCCEEHYMYKKGAIKYHIKSPGWGWRDRYLHFCSKECKEKYKKEGKRFEKQLKDFYTPWHCQRIDKGLWCHFKNHA